MEVRDAGVDEVTSKSPAVIVAAVDHAGRATIKAYKQSELVAQASAWTTEAGWRLRMYGPNVAATGKRRRRSGQAKGLARLAGKREATRPRPNGDRNAYTPTTSVTTTKYLHVASRTGAPNTTASWQWGGGS